MWLTAAFFSALFAGLTSILAKCGIRKTDSDVATAIRTGVVLLFSLVMVGVVGSFDTLGTVSGRSFLFLILSGLSTGASWICYFKALSLGNVNKVVPIDKSSTVITVLSAILLFGETDHLAARLGGTLLLAAGIYLMIEKKDTQPGQASGVWFLYAVGSALFAALTSIFAKVGIDGVESNLGTAVRTVVVLMMAWGIVIARGKLPMVGKVERRELLFLILSGIATGASWLCYYYALQKGVVSVVVPIDKLSILVSILFSRVFFGEKLKPKSFAGLLLMTAGILGMAVLT